MPKYITHLTFINKFNKKINDLPNTITYLTFGDNFNQYIKIFPKKLTSSKEIFLKIPKH